MEPASPLLSAGLTLFCLLGAVRLSAGDGSHCPCPKIPPWPRTRVPPEECRQINDTFRYSCSEGFVRKAGTSNRIKCKLINKVGGWEIWNSADIKLQCIDDPKRIKPLTTPQSTTPKNHSNNSQDTTTTTSTATSSTSIHMNQSTVSQDGKRRNSTDEKAHDAVTSTATAKTRKAETTTFSRNISNNHTDPSAGAHSETHTAAIVSPVLLVLICALTGIGFTLYRRRSRNNISQQQQQSEEELEPMNPTCRLPS